MFLVAIIFGAVMALIAQILSLFIIPMQQGSIKFKSRLWIVLSVIAFIYGFYLGTIV